MKKPITYLIILLIIPFFQGCKGGYSLTGASIDYTKVKTFSVDYFPNHSDQVNPNLSQAFTEELKNIFLQQTNLDLVQNNGDLQFSGHITGYKTSYQAVQGNEQAALNRLTMTVKVKYVNTTEEKDNFERNFTRFAEYDASQDFNTVESGLVEDINQQLVQDIFNASVSNW